MNPLIKWPGGKSGEIQKIRQYIPEYDRYVEPFFGGGALFFHLRPRAAAINDISGSLMEYYTLIQQQDEQLRDLLLCYSDSFSGLIGACNRRYDTLLELYQSFCREDLSLDALRGRLAALSASLVASLPPDFYEKLQPDIEAFTNSLTRYALDKLRRTRNNALKKPFSDEDLQANLITGFTCGYYMYFRDLYNAMQAHRMKPPSPAYRAANFYFIREYCYGSMFRYNANGEFNIPYGGKSYNKKNMRAKIDHIFCDEVRELFANTELCCMDFGDFFRHIHLTERDFMFLDPPYDTDFSDYEGRACTKKDQERLAAALRETPARFILVIKNTEFIRSLYEKDFHILSFDKRYTYNVRSRNERRVEHLIITNLPV